VRRLIVGATNLSESSVSGDDEDRSELRFKSSVKPREVKNSGGSKGGW
jgi:hypothetical protein